MTRLAAGGVPMPAAATRRPAPSGTEARFRRFLSDDWGRWMVQAPEIATSVGYPGLNDLWSDDSPAGIEARDRHLRESVRALAGFPPSHLGPTERLNHRLYARLLAAAVAGRAFGDDPFPYHFGYPRNLWMPINQMDGIHTSSGQLVAIQPRQARADVEAIIARLQRLPVAVEQHLALLQEGRRRGHMPPRIAIRGVPDQVAALVPEDPDGSAFLEPFHNLPSTVPADDRRRLTEEALRAYRHGVRAAFLKLHRYLVDTYLPGARETIGAVDLPNGRAAYAHHVRWVTTTDLSPEEIHRIGLAEVERLDAEIAELIRGTGFPGSVAEFHRFLRTDERFRFRSVEDLLERYRALAKRIDPELAHHFGVLPRLPYGVEPVPAFQAPSVPAAFYIGGAPRDGRPGVFYVNTYDVASRPTWRMESLTLHEAVPGHHLQIARTAELESVPEFRQFSGETAYVEGWGLYAETLGEEVGLYRDPYAKFGALDHDVWRAIRLVVDTGMHALGWSRDRAIEFFRAHTGMNDHEIEVEVDRYIVWPAQALAYKLGQLKIRELRTLAEKSLGERFDERAFHDVVLEEGSLPLGELEARVRSWIGRPTPAPARTPRASKARLPRKSAPARRPPRRR